MDLPGDHNRFRVGGEVDYIMILFANPKAQYDNLASDIKGALHTVLESGRYLSGEEVRQFEEEFAAFVGMAHCVAVGSGTQALQIGLMALGVGPGDEVITPSHTASATVTAIIMAGAIPVLVDIEENSYCLDLAQVQSAITDKTRVILPVHLYGHPADMVPLMELAKDASLYVVEDCAQAHGASYDSCRVGSFGSVSCFSFYPTKNLGALGDAGAVLFRTEELALRARAIREYGWTKKFYSEMSGVNGRMDSIQAAVLRLKLNHLVASNDARRKIAGRYDEALEHSSLVVPKAASNCRHVYHQYVVRSSRRDALRTYLEDRGIQTGVHYPFAVHQQPGYKEQVSIPHKLTTTEKMVKEVLSLPIYPELSDCDVDFVVDSIQQFWDLQ